MSKPKLKFVAKKPEALFGRVVSILEQARGNVVRAVNTNMVLAYWLIGREIVQELQGGKGRAEYGKRVVEDLSVRLTERYGQGFSVPNLKNFRQFYQVYSMRSTSIGYPVGSDRRQIFASKYMLCLPTEEQLRTEVEKERRLIESTLKECADE